MCIHPKWKPYSFISEVASHCWHVRFKLAFALLANEPSRVWDRIGGPHLHLLQERNAHARNHVFLLQPHDIVHPFFLCLSPLRVIEVNSLASLAKASKRFRQPWKQWRFWCGVEVQINHLNHGARKHANSEPITWAKMYMAYIESIAKWDFAAAPFSAQLGTIIFGAI